jgi:nicotinamidase-related amidase
MSEKPVFLIIDMVKDNLDPGKKYPITEHAMQIIQPINHAAGIFRRHGWPVIFSTDAYRKEDFIFKGKLKPHSLVGTTGAEVTEMLHVQPEDLWLPKPRFSAFFNTGLEEILHRQAVTMCVVGGIATHFCVLTTAMDAVCHDFKAVLLSDCSASYSTRLHEQTLGLYRKNPLYPLLRVLTSEELLSELTGTDPDV